MRRRRKPFAGSAGEVTELLRRQASCASDWRSGAPDDPRAAARLERARFDEGNLDFDPPAGIGDRFLSRAVAKSEVAVILLAIRWASHGLRRSWKEYGEKYGKLLVVLGLAATTQTRTASDPDASRRPFTGSPRTIAGWKFRRREDRYLSQTKAPRGNMKATKNTEESSPLCFLPV